MAGGIDWFRWHHGSVADPKFQLVAHKAGARLGDVIAVWAFILEIGSAHGASVGEFDPIRCDHLLGLESGASVRIYEVLEARGFIVSESVSNARRYFPSAGMRPSGGTWESIRRLIFKRDDYTCRYCGARGVRLECDHVVPVADGGAHSDANLVTACFDCNRSKGSRSLPAWEACRGW